jgi:hypothetical protein
VAHHARPRVGPSITRNSGPGGTPVRSFVQSAKTDHAHGSIPTSRRRSPFPCRISRLPRRSVAVGLGEREGLLDPNARAPQHNDQTSHPPAVMTISGLAHDRDDLLDRGRIRRIPAALVGRDPPGVIARRRRRRPRSAGNIQQLMSRHGSLLWRADRFAACSNRGEPEAGVASQSPLPSRLLPHIRPVAEASQSALLIVPSESSARSDPRLAGCRIATERQRTVASATPRSSAVA